MPKAFRENEIDDTVLPNLTAEDLKDLGVSIVGHRRKLPDAIAALRPDTEPKTAPAAPKSPAQPTDSTGIAARLDAEEWRDLVNAYLDDASAAVRETGGHVAKKLGDGLMALFGYPLAHENDAERAARAALSVHRALAELDRKNAGTLDPLIKCHPETVKDQGSF
jgi:hypothetical protein